MQRQIHPHMYTLADILRGGSCTVASIRTHTVRYQAVVSSLKNPLHSHGDKKRVSLLADARTIITLSESQSSKGSAAECVCVHVCECLCVRGCKGPPLTRVKWGSFVMQQVLLSVNLS